MWIFNDSYTNTSSSLIDVIYSIVPISTEGCEGDSFTVTVAINPEPVVANQDVTVCSDEAIGVTLNPSSSVAVASFNIIDINANGLQAGTSNSIVSNVVSADALENDTYTNNSNNPVDVVYTIVPVSSGGVEGVEFTVSITVNPKPIVTAQEVEVCSGEILGVDFNASIGIDAATYNITVLNLNGLIVNSGAPSVGFDFLPSDLSDDSFVNETGVPVDVVYTVLPVSSEGCEGEPFTVTVTVNSAPVVADITDTVNSGDVIGVTLGADTDGAPAISNYRITGITTNGLERGLNNSVNNSTILSDGIFNDSYTNTSSSLIDVIYTIVPISTEGCEGDSFTVTVAINPEPVVANQDVTVCSDEAIGVTLNPSSSVAVASFNIIDINANGLQAGTSNSIVSNVVSADALENDTYTNNSNNPVDVVYTIVPVSSGGVEGVEFTVSITVNPKPIVTAQEVEVCSGEILGVDFNASIGIDAATYNITVLNLNGLIVNSGAPSVGFDFLPSDLSDDSFVNETGVPVDVVYTVLPVSSEGCEGEPFTVTVTVNPKLVDPDFSITPSDILRGLFAIDDPISFKNTSSGPYDPDLLTWYIDGEEVSDQEEFTYTFDKIGSYEVILEVGFVNSINNFACIYTKSETINVTEEFNIILPTAFTPNNDGFNDVIRPIFKYVQNIEMSIYDSWGVLLYYEKNSNKLKGWDGFVKGKAAPLGYYNIIVKGTTFYGKNFVKSTAIRLIR